MLTIYGRKTSSNVQPVMWAIAEMGLECDRLDYGHKYGGNDTPEYLAMNPNGLVPTLKDGDLILWESGAILRYLAARYGSETFWPREPAARAPIDMWAEWGKVTLGTAFTHPIFWQMVRTPAAQRDEQALARSLAKFETLVDILDDRLEGRAYVAGDDLTAADIFCGNLLYRYFDLDLPRADRPNLDRYYETLAERPAYRTHVMLPYDELRVEGA